MAARAALLALFGFLAALVACSETLRLPPPTSGAAGALPSAAGEYASATRATGGGLVSGGGGGGPGGGSFGPGAGGGGGMAAIGGMGATGGAAIVGAGGTMAGPGGPGSGPAAPWVSEGRGKYTELKSVPIGMSRDGNRVLDRAGFLWIDEGTPSATLTPTSSSPTGISADGSTVIGETGAPPCPLATVWSAGTLFVSKVMVGPVALSSDGTTILATLPLACPPGGPRALVSLRSSSPANLQFIVLDPLAGDDATEAFALSGDGKVAFGFSSTRADGATGRLFSWRGGPTMALHDTKIRRPGFGVLASADGSVVAMTLIDAAGSDAAYVSRSAGALQPLPKPASRGQSLALGLSADGATVLALGTNAPAGPPVAAAQEGLPYTWSAASGAETLAVPAGVMGFETALMTPDASLIVGNPTPNPGMPVVVWNRQRTPGFVFDDAPMFVQRCRPFVTNVSDDGKTFAGSCGATGRMTGFVARLP